MHKFQRPTAAGKMCAPTFVACIQSASPNKHLRPNEAVKPGSARDGTTRNTPVGRLAPGVWARDKQAAAQAVVPGVPSAGGTEAGGWPGRVLLGVRSVGVRQVRRQQREEIEARRQREGRLYFDWKGERDLKHRRASLTFQMESKILVSLLLTERSGWSSQGPLTDHCCVEVKLKRRKGAVGARREEEGAEEG